MTSTCLAETEVRVLPMKDGSHHPFRGDLIMWQTFDYLQITYEIETEWLVNLAYIDVVENNVSFEDAFENIVAYVCREYDKKAKNK